MASLVSVTVMAAAMGVVPDFGPDFNASSLPNMNGDYVLSSTPGADMSK